MSGGASVIDKHDSHIPLHGILKLFSFCSLLCLDTGKVDLTMNVVERPNGGFSAGGGISSGWVALTLFFFGGGQQVY